MFGLIRGAQKRPLPTTVRIPNPHWRGIIEGVTNHWRGIIEGVTKRSWRGVEGVTNHWRGVIPNHRGRGIERITNNRRGIIPNDRRRIERRVPNNRGRVEGGGGVLLSDHGDLPLAVWGGGEGGGGVVTGCRADWPEHTATRHQKTSLRLKKNINILLNLVHCWCSHTFLHRGSLMQPPWPAQLASVSCVGVLVQLQEAEPGKNVYKVNLASINWR